MCPVRPVEIRRDPDADARLLVGPRRGEQRIRFIADRLDPDARQAADIVPVQRLVILGVVGVIAGARPVLAEVAELRGVVQLPENQRGAPIGIGPFAPGLGLVRGAGHELEVVRERRADLRRVIRQGLGGAAGAEEPAGEQVAEGLGRRQGRTLLRLLVEPILDALGRGFDRGRILRPGAIHVGLELIDLQHAFGDIREVLGLPGPVEVIERLQVTRLGEEQRRQFRASLGELTRGRIR